MSSHPPFASVTKSLRDKILLMVLSAHENASEGLDPVSGLSEPLHSYPKELDDIAKIVFSILSGYEPQTRLLHLHDRASLLLDVAKSINLPREFLPWQPHGEPFEIIYHVALLIPTMREQLPPGGLLSIQSRLFDAFNSVCSATLEQNKIPQPFVMDLNRVLLESMHSSDPSYEKLLIIYQDHMDHYAQDVLNDFGSAKNIKMHQAAVNQINQYLNFIISQTGQCKNNLAPMHAIADSWQIYSNGAFVLSYQLMIDSNLHVALMVSEDSVVAESAWNNIATAIAESIQANDLDLAERMLERLLNRASEDPYDPSNAPKKHHKLTTLFEDGMALLEAKKSQKTAPIELWTPPLQNLRYTVSMRPIVIRAFTIPDGPQT